ncbi:MAG: hypothetical protein EA356_15610 [Geminicoccaceae bacterium]|nr:MAG: hypothetical protein EA356_15610 [Geminicoccaceae bacterium]
MTRTTTLLLATALVLGSAAAMAQPMWSGGKTGAGVGPARGPMAMEQMLEAFDRTGDGRVTQAEIDQTRAERHAAFDADGDGVLTLEEYEALWLDAMRPRMVRAFQALDVDGNGQVTVEEFQRPFARALDRIVTEEDGVLTRSDVRRQMQERQGMRADRPGRPGDMPGRRGMDRPGPMWQQQ